MLRLIKWVAIVLVLAAGAAWIDQILPRYDVVRIAGTDTKRLDSSGYFDSESPNVKATNTRDVRFINTVYPNGSVRVFRNEDTDWGFPWYYKFDSGNLMAQAQALQSGGDNPKWVVVRSYGWRVPFLTMFPNVLAIRPATGPDESVLPLLKIFVFTLLAILLIWLYIWLRRFKRRRIDPFFARIGGRAETPSPRIEDQAAVAQPARSGFGSRLRRWLGMKPKGGQL